MLSIRIENLSQLTYALSSSAGSLNFVKSLAINTVARHVRAEVLNEFRVKFDRPTPVTMRSLFTRPADYKKQPEPFAEVLVKDDPTGLSKSRRSIAEIIGHQFVGGSRIPKRSEELLRTAGYLRSNEFIAPGPDAKLDPYGNVSRGQMQQILSALRAQFDPYSNRTSSERSRRNARRAGNIFYSDGRPVVGRKKTVRRGIWASDRRGDLKLLLVIIPSPGYQRLIDMQSIGDRVCAREWPAAVEAAWQKAQSLAFTRK